jgi:DMSO/TMAO reductase YedYZ molybdopterin-dependent catalytic subunit
MMLLMSCNGPASTAEPTEAVVEPEREIEVPAGTLVIVTSESSVAYTLEDLRSLPESDAEYNGRTYTGVQLQDLLTNAGVDVQAVVALKAEASDGYRSWLGPETLLSDSCIVAYLRNGVELSSSEGPLRLIVTGNTESSVKMLNQLLVE